MRLFGTIEFDSEENSYITNISTNLDNYKDSDNVYYTDKEKADPLYVYDPNEEDWDADWLPYNCIITEWDIYCKDNIYYWEGEEPEDAVCGKLISIYREGKQTEKYFKKYD